ncbi:MAG: phage holin family protein [Paludibacteraceae bacterium]
MAEKKGTADNKSNGFQKLFFEVKDYVDIKIDYLKVVSVEKLTKIVSLLILLATTIILATAIFFYLMFALAYALAPHLGFIASFAIVAGVLFLKLVILLVFRKNLIINPILKMMVKLFDDESTETELENEDDTSVAKK